MLEYSARPASQLTQFAALCWREKGPDVEILLITSRETGRWVIPKGWPMDGKSMAEAAAREAWEEAGVRGLPHPVPIGTYSYQKSELGGTMIEVLVFCMRADTVSEKFPESKQRKRCWLPPAQAASRVAEPELAGLIETFV